MRFSADLHGFDPFPPRPHPRPTAPIAASGSLRYARDRLSARCRRTAAVLGDAHLGHRHHLQHGSRERATTPVTQHASPRRVKRRPSACRSRRGRVHAIPLSLSRETNSRKNGQLSHLFTVRSVYAWSEGAAVDECARCRRWVYRPDEVGGRVQRSPDVASQIRWRADPTTSVCSSR
jgi:hypothetical protein